MTASSTQPAPWPRLGASAAIFREGRVLIGERGKGALAGQWSLPGGHVEPGERAADAARREILEETSITARILGLVDLHEVIRREAGAGAVTWHYAIAVHFGIWMAGEPVAADDCRAARFVTLGDLDQFQLTEGAKALIHRAAELVTAASTGTRQG